MCVITIIALVDYNVYRILCNIAARLTTVDAVNSAHVTHRTTDCTSLSSPGINYSHGSAARPSHEPSNTCILEITLVLASIPSTYSNRRIVQEGLPVGVPCLAMPSYLREFLALPASNHSMRTSWSVRPRTYSNRYIR